MKFVFSSSLTDEAKKQVNRNGFILINGKAVKVIKNDNPAIVEVKGGK